MPIDCWEYKEFARKFGIRAKGVVTNYGEVGGRVQNSYKKGDIKSFSHAEWGRGAPTDLR